MILYGEIPEYDMEGHSCLGIKDALKLKEASYHESVQPTYFTSMTCCGEFAETTASQPVERIQCLAKDGTEILTSYEDEMCGFIKTVGSGVICAVTGDYPADKKFWSRVFEQMEICPAIEISYYRDGIYASRTRDGKGQELFYLINLDCEDKVITVREEGHLLWEKFELGQKASLVLPRNVVVSGVEIMKSTAEIFKVTESSIGFSLTQMEDAIYLHTDRKLLPSEEYTIYTDDSWTVVRSRKGKRNRDYINVRVEERRRNDGQGHVRTESGMPLM